MKQLEDSPQKITLNSLHEAWQLSGQSDDDEPVADTMIGLLVRDIGLNEILRLIAKNTTSDTPNPEDYYSSFLQRLDEDLKQYGGMLSHEMHVGIEHLVTSRAVLAVNNHELKRRLGKRA